MFCRTVPGMRIDVAALLRAHAFLRTEAPPEPWTPDADDATFVPLLGEMIGAALASGNELSDLTLSFANLVVSSDDDPEAPPMPEGELVGITVRGGGRWEPERTWRPDAGADPPPFVSPSLEAAAARAGAVFGYTRSQPDGGAVVVWFRRAD